MKTEERQPLISIVMPVYNCSDYLVGALDSILSQTYKNWELIAIDDASVDDSYLILSQYALLDERIKLFKNHNNMGVGRTLDKGMQLASGDYIARMDGDDICMPDRLEKQIRYLQNNPGVVGVGGQVRMINEHGKFIGNKNFPTKDKVLYNMLYNAVPIQHPALMINKKLLPKDFTWYDGWPTAQDLYLYFKLVNFGKLANLKDYILDYRYYRGGNSLRDPKKTFRLTREIREIAVTEFDYIPTVKAKFVHYLQIVLVSVLPNFVIPTMFRILRSFMSFAKLANGNAAIEAVKEVTKIASVKTKAISS